MDWDDQILPQRIANNTPGSPVAIMWEIVLRVAIFEISQVSTKDIYVVIFHWLYILVSNINKTIIFKCATKCIRYIQVNTHRYFFKKKCSSDDTIQCNRTCKKKA